MGQKILVVEDNELNLKLFCDLLRAHGYAVEPVRDGREALARARDFAPDMVVMDIQMPHISGLELIEQIKGDADLRHMPIMAVTAYAAKGDEERIRDAGAEGYVSKPITLMKFIEAVRGLLGLAAERAAAVPVPDVAEGPPDASEPAAMDEATDGEVEPAEAPDAAHLEADGATEESAPGADSDEADREAKGQDEAPEGAA